MWIVEYKSPRPSPKLLAKGGIIKLICLTKNEAQRIVYSLQQRGIESTIYKQEERA